MKDMFRKAVRPLLILLLLAGCSQSEPAPEVSSSVPKAIRARILYDSNRRTEEILLPTAKEGYAPYSLQFYDDGTFSVNQIEWEKRETLYSSVYRTDNQTLVEEFSYPVTALSPKYSGPFPTYIAHPLILDGHYGRQAFEIFAEKKAEPATLSLSLPEGATIFGLSPQVKKALCGREEHYFLYDLETKTETPLTEGVLKDTGETAPVFPYIFSIENYKEASNPYTNFLTENYLIIYYIQNGTKYWGMLDLTTFEIIPSSFEMLPFGSQPVTWPYVQAYSANSMALYPRFESSHPYYLLFSVSPTPSIRREMVGGQVQSLFFSEDGSKMAVCHFRDYPKYYQITVLHTDTLYPAWKMIFSANNLIRNPADVRKAISNDGKALLLADNQDQVYLFRQNDSVT